MAETPESKETGALTTKQKIGELSPKTRELVTSHVNAQLFKIVLAFGAMNVLALASIWWVAVNTASDAAKTVARETATDAFNNVAKSQKISDEANAHAMAVFKSSSETFGRVTVLKEMLDQVESQKIAELAGSVNTIEAKLLKLAALLDEKEADKKIQLLKAAELFKDNDLVQNLNARFEKIEKTLGNDDSKLDLLSRFLDTARTDISKLQTDLTYQLTRLRVQIAMDYVTNKELEDVLNKIAPGGKVTPGFQVTVEPGTKPIVPPKKKN